MSDISLRTGGQRSGRAFPLCPGISDINLFRYCQGVKVGKQASILAIAWLYPLDHYRCGRGGSRQVGLSIQPLLFARADEVIE